VLAEDRVAPVAPVAAAELLLATLPVANVRARVTALAPSPDGAWLWIGTFDRGLFRAPLDEQGGGLMEEDGVVDGAADGPRAGTADGPFAALHGAESFVNALQLDGTELLVATSRGVVRLDAATGARIGKVAALAERAVLAFAAGSGARLYAAASDGVWVLEHGAAWKLPGYVSGAAVTALAADPARDRLYAGTARGVDAIALDAAGRVTGVVHHALVVGPTAAASAWAVALAVDPASGDAWAGTDDAGLVRIPSDGAPTEAHPLLPRVASMTSPGAALALGDGAVLFGTQGAGATLAAAGAPPVRLTAATLAEPTALAARAGVTWIATATGAVVALAH